MSNADNMEVDRPEQNEEMEEQEDDEENTSDEDEEEEGEGEEAKTFVPGTELEKGEELAYDEGAYIVYHQASLGPPCLSFDIIQEGKFEFPLELVCVAGTQAAKVNGNNIIVFKMSNLHPNRAVKDEDDDDDDDGEVPTEELPHLKMAGIKHTGCVNRVKYANIGGTPVAAAWSETGTVAIWNLSAAMSKLEAPGKGDKDVYREESAPLQSFSGHQVEGYALDWSPTHTGLLASGDCKKNIHLWTPADGGTWQIDSRPFTSHTASVEDIRWSPNEKNVMASCSCDRTIKIWDIRAAPSKACMLTQGNAHFSDINVIDWNPNDPFIISGGDDGIIKVWDLRQFGGISDPVATFKHHGGPVTSLEWHRDDSTVFASSGDDHQIALWDLAVERDSEASDELSPELKDLPPQLLFIHQGMKDVKELHWHPRVPGLVMATSHTGFDVFRTISV